jgi:DNA-binding beta-propeller fold protein YncE
MTKNIMNMKMLRPVAILVVLLPLLLLASGCATKKPSTANYVMFPAPPDEPRIQFLWGFGSETDLGGRGRFNEFIVGEESVYRPIVKPYGVAIKNGKIYVCDTQAGNVSISDLKTRRMRYIKPVGQAALKTPIGIAVDEDGTIYVTDTGRGQILVFDAKGNLLHTLGQKDEMKPAGLALHQNNIFVADAKNSVVRVYDKVSRQLTRTIPQNETDDKKKLFSPTNLAIDARGRLVVSDSGGFAVKIYDLEGKHIQTLGELGVSPGQFAMPKGVGVDGEGRVYVLDAAVPVIQMFDAEGRLLMFFGQPSSSGPGGLWLPAGLAVDRDNLGFFTKYVAPGYRLDYIILVTNQVGPRKVSVFGFVTKM